jgi:hypothetical protein
MIPHRLLLRLTRNMPARSIANNYMLRYFVGHRFGWTCYLHQFLNGDAERHLHNHPFDKSLAFVLRGFYREERLRRLCPINGPICRPRYVRWLNIINPSDFHRITGPLTNTWTLFFLRRSADYGWGFIEQHDGHPYFRAAGDGHVGGDRWWQRPDVKTGAELRREIGL